ncbi:nucleotidyltransferase family protein [Paenibacillus glucanolyticus]|uniref:nucleotidyltransferase family protein n=1 Tax=Paenibacillus glucanolyticus TaxID=59843 RepID=UPI00128B898F|nr:nucleotidyltransferase family protein [Paenibacillus glucanolyticus]MPY18636.1 nucleotidyltransferase family protein [Paenibacillus glucanolyticus]
MKNQDVLVTFLDELYQGRLPSLDEMQYVNLMMDIDLFDIAPQVFAELRQKGLSHQVSEQVRLKLSSEADIVLIQNFLIKTELKMILQTFEASCIEVIPLKGTQLAERYFGGLAARGTTDIDLLVGKKDLHQASDLLISLGFDKVTGDPTHFHEEYVKPLNNASFPSLTVELHWNIIREDFTNTDVSRLWRDASLMSGCHYVYELSPLHTFYHICLHGMNHHMMSMKYFVDIATLIHVMDSRLEYAELLDVAAADRNLSKVWIALSLAYDMLPHLQRLKPMPMLPYKFKYPGWNLEKARKVMLGRKGFSYSWFRIVTAFTVHDTWGQRWSQLGFLIWNLPLLWIRKREIFR